VRFGNLHGLIFSLLLALGAASPAIAQQGQYRLAYLPFTLPNSSSEKGVATYSELYTIDNDSIHMRTDEGDRFNFKLGPNTIFCQGSIKVADGSFLKTFKKKPTITVLTSSYQDTNALVVWDRGPQLSISTGISSFALPPLCK
jgi:hypothetical protein